MAKSDTVKITSSIHHEAKPKNFSRKFVSAQVFETVHPELGANRNLVTSFRWGWYLLSLIIPFAGIFIGLFLYDQDSKEVRKVGRNSLLLGFLVWVAFPLFLFMALFFLGTMTALSWLSDVIPPMN